MSDISTKSYRKKLAERGAFYTDPKLAADIKKYIPDDVTEVYDPTCGGGNLLASFGDSVKKYGQELDEEQANYCRERLTNCEIVAGDTLKNPAFMDRKFKAIVANYPFSVSWEQNKDDPRFDVAPALAPKSKADFAFILHIIHILADDGVASCLCSPGIGYRGNAEGKIRQWLIEQNYIDTVVLYEGGYFEDTSISTMLLVLRKNKTTTDITFTDHKLNKSRVVPIEEVRSNSYNLSVNCYIQEEVKREVIDTVAVQKDIYKTEVETLRNVAELQFMLLDIDTGLKKGDFVAFLNEVQSVVDEYMKKVSV